jgi:hypothetical protein
MILCLYFPEFKEINALRAQAGYGFMEMNGQRSFSAQITNSAFQNLPWSAFKQMSEQASEVKA